jgi:hypothetical protein
LKQVDDALEH